MTNEDPAVALREAQAADALTIGALATQVFLDTYATEGIRPDLAREALAGYSVEAFAQRLQETGRRFVLAERGDRLIGFVEWLDASACPAGPVGEAPEVVRLHVQPRFQSRGIGRRLLERAEAVAAAGGAANVWLTAWSGNHAALRFYAKAGYTTIGTTQYVFEGQAYLNHVCAKALA